MFVMVSFFVVVVVVGAAVAVVSQPYVCSCRREIIMTQPPLRRKRRSKKHKQNLMPVPNLLPRLTCRFFHHKGFPPMNLHNTTLRQKKLEETSKERARLEKEAKEKAERDKKKKVGSPPSSLSSRLPLPPPLKRSILLLRNMGRICVNTLGEAI